jgi:predicted phosphoadenosine phosphosulfate sulfurtransferase
VLKRYLDIDVLEAARQRIARTFDDFPRVYLSFSAGKDSTVMLHLVADEARRRGRKFGLLLIDLEAQFQVTMDHGEALFREYADCTEPFWVSLPIHLRNAVSVYEPFWTCWDPEARDAWVRQPPDFAVVDEKHFPFFWRAMEFEEFVPLFGEWYGCGERCACFVGIRTDESLNRFRTIALSDKETWRGLRWTSRVGEQQLYNAYPIYDWHVDDLWTYHAKNPERQHNRLYDLMHQAGLTPHQMRICQPYGDDQRRNLWLYHVVEPQTWARVVARVNGANGGATYIQEWGNINGYRRVTKPPGHTWRSFAELLVASMPPKSREHYRNKVLLFEKWWTERGYPGGIPDEADYDMEAQRKAPSWRRVCKTLLRNDYWGKGLGFSQQKSEGYEAYLKLMRRRKAEWKVEQEALGFKVNSAVEAAEENA